MFAGIYTVFPNEAEEIESTLQRIQLLYTNDKQRELCNEELTTEFIDAINQMTRDIESTEDEQEQINIAEKYMQFLLTHFQHIEASLRHNTLSTLH